MILLRILASKLPIVLLLVAFLARPARAGGLHEDHFDASVLGRSWTYEIYLPKDYAQSDRRYPVIYLLHGYNDVPTSWADKAGIVEMADRMIAEGVLSPCILVMPSAGRSWYIDGPEKMETAFIDDLIPQIDSHYRTRHDRSGRMVAGLSMGGYGAMRLALRHPDRFSAMALMSPAIYAPDPPFISGARVAPAFQTDGIFDPERWRAMNYPSLLESFAKTGRSLRVQLSAGLQDPYGTETAAQNFATAWRHHRWPAELKLMQGAHDFAFWRTALPGALRFLAGPDSLGATQASR